MGFINLIFVPSAVIFAFIALITNIKHRALLVLASEAFCAVLPMTAIMDINERMASNDYAGIEDIYPTMFYVYIAVFVLVTVLNVITVVRKDRR